MNSINWMAARTEITLTAKEYKDTKSNYLFYNSTERILELCEQYGKKDLNYRESNKSISVVGERGSGKTSVVKTVSDILKERDFFVFDIVDPGVFSGSMSLLELFISKLYLYINNNDEEKSHFGLFQQSNNKEILKFKIIEEIKEIMDTLANFRIDKSVFSNENISMEVLNDINSRVSFSKKLSELINYFREYSGKEKIVLCIDDLDLVDNKNIHNMLEDMRKYLVKDIIVIVSYRDVQLLDAIVQKNLTENRVLKDGGFIEDSDIYNQSTKYIEKLLPLSSRVYLQKTNEVWNEKNSAILGALLDAEEIKYEDEFVEKYKEHKNDEETEKVLRNATVKEWLTFAIFKKTKINIKPEDAKEEMIVGLPDNMRGLLQLIEIVHERLIMPDNKDEKEYLKTIGENLRIFKEYYYDFIGGKLLIEEMKIIKNWEESPVRSKNYNIYQAFFHKIKKSVLGTDKEMKSIENMDQLLNINLVSNENVTIGDVYEMLERYKMTNANNPREIFFVYVLKVIYSIELLQLYINGNTVEENMDSYLILLNHKITPDTLIYVEKSDNIFKYKKELITNGLLSENTQISKLINNITYTIYTANGENNRNNRIKLEVENKEIKNDNILLQTKNITYAYRKFFNKNSEVADVKNNYSYYFDLLTLVTKKNYIDNSLQQKKYIYYSMFDMDKLLRVNFSGGNSNYSLNSVVDQIKNLFDFSSKEKSFTYLYEDFENEENTNIFSEYTKADWDAFDLFLINRQKIIESFEEIKKSEIEGDDSLLLKYKELESDLYSIDKYTDSPSLATRIANFEKSITSNVIIIPNSKKGLRDAIKNVLEKERNKFNSDEVRELNAMVANTKLKGSLNQEDKNRFRTILSKKGIRNG